MALYLAETEQLETATVELLHPATDRPTNSFVTVAGPMSERFKTAREAWRKRNDALDRRYRSAENVPEDLKGQSNIEFLADLVIDVKDVYLQDGTPLQPNKSALMAFFLDERAFGHKHVERLSREVARSETFLKR